MGKRYRLVVRSAGALVLSIGLAWAGDEVPDYAATTLTGDWGGLRPAWHERGLAVDLGYRWDMLRVASGGTRRGGRPMSHFDLKAKGDLEPLVGWEGATAYVNLIYDGGGKTNRDFLGSQLGVSNIEVPVSTARLFHAWVEQSFDDGKWGVLAGLYPIDSEFQVLDSAALFVQPPYGAAPDLALTRGPSIFNNPALGLRAKWQSDDRTVYAVGAALDGIPGDPNHPKGTHVRLRAGDGTMAIAEIGYKPREFGHVFEPLAPEKGVPAEPEIRAHEAGEGYEKYAVGLWRYTARVDDLVDVDALGNPERRRSAGWYALAERTLWRGGGREDVAGFLRFGATDGNSTAIQRFYNVGMRIAGLVRGRENDLFGLAHTRGSIGTKFRTSQAVAGVALADAESATEATYRIQVNKWLAVQPLVQRFRHPAGANAAGAATVVGLRIDVAL